MEEPKKKRGFIHTATLEIIISKRLIARAFFTLILMAIFVYLLWLLFYKDIQGSHRDILNVIIGCFLGVFADAAKFWFKRDDEDAKIDKADPTD